MTPTWIRFVCSALVAAMDDSVSEFIVHTCRLIPKSNTNIFDSLYLQVALPFEHHGIACGSSAEFFIQPIRSCIGDMDLFTIKTHAFAFTDKKPEFPYEIRHNADIIDCFSMEPYLDYPSFVRLRSLGKLRYKWERRIFEFEQTDVQEVAITTTLYESERDKKDQKTLKVGPARKLIGSELDSFSVDSVLTLWCPQWPNEAKDWPHRQRKYGWPTVVKIQEIVQNGCHVVDAKHRACRSDIHQCRLSFSVAELILLQSWTQVQQIVYHMIRFFAKRELIIRKDCPKEDEVLCSYHLKTLMLWSCEEMSPEWWNSLSVIKICCNLFQKLSKWLKETSCPNYFVAQANLFHERFNLEIVNETINRLTHYSDSDILSLWFLEHYIQSGFLGVIDEECSSDIISVVYEHMRQTCDKPENVDSYISARISVVIETTRETVRMGFKKPRLDYFQNILRMGSLFENTSDFRPSAVIESGFNFYWSMLRILFIVHLLDCDEMQYCIEWFIETIREISIKPKFVICRHHNIPWS